MLELSADTLDAGGLEGFDSFVAQVAEFLTFKHLSLPGGVRFDVVVGLPGQELSAAGGRRARLWGVVNLGNEETSAVLAARSALSESLPVRLTLGTGEGVRTPDGELFLGTDPEGKRGADVMLLISGERPNSACRALIG